VGNVPVGQSASYQFEYTFTAPGTYTLEAFVDSDSEVSELSEANNRATYAVSVTGGS
jgi:subtilase family serine protease